MKALSIILLSFFLLSFTGKETLQDKETTVIICTGKYSKRYHNKICKGLKNCKGDTKKIYLSEAKKRGLTACGYCYK
jgi:hypothetical protein